MQPNRNTRSPVVENMQDGEGNGTMAIIICIIWLIVCSSICSWKLFLYSRASCSHSLWAVLISVVVAPPLDALSLLWENCCKVGAKCLQ